MKHPRQVHLACSLLTFVVLHLAFVAQLRAAVPQLLNYQGRVAVGTVNFDGSGSFKFALVNSDGTTTYWSNDGTSTAGSEPAAAVALTVTRGLYSVLLGDTALANMIAIPASVFDNADVRLRVWFNDGTNGSQLLTPDQRIVAVGYAMMAGNVPDGVITGAKLAAGAVGSSQLAAGAVTSTKISAKAVTSGKLADGAVGSAQLAAGLNFGGTSSAEVFQVTGNPELPAHLLGAIASGTDLSGAFSVTVSGNHAYVTRNASNALTILDISNPVAPTVVKILQDGVGGFDLLAGTSAVAISGTTAYVVSQTDNSLTIIDVADPANPILKSAIQDGIGGFNLLGGAFAVAVSGNIACVTARNDGGVTLIDVTDPANPILKAQIQDGVGGFNLLAGPRGVKLIGNRAYVSSFADNALTIIDVTEPANPSLLSEIQDGVTDAGGRVFNLLQNAYGVEVSGAVAYVASAGDDSLTIIDVSNPGSPRLLAEIQDGVGGFTELDAARSVVVADHFAYIASPTDDSLTIIDVINPHAPKLVAQFKDESGGFNLLNGANWVAVSGSTVFVTSVLDNSLTILSNPRSSLEVSGTVTATALRGDGSGLTDVTANALSSDGVNAVLSVLAARAQAKADALTAIIPTLGPAITQKQADITALTTQISSLNAQLQMIEVQRSVAQTNYDEQRDDAIFDYTWGNPLNQPDPGNMNTWVPIHTQAEINAFIAAYPPFDESSFDQQVATVNAAKNTAQAAKTTAQQELAALQTQLENANVDLRAALSLAEIAGGL